MCGGVCGPRDRYQNSFADRHVYLRGESASSEHSCQHDKGDRRSRPKLKLNITMSLDRYVA